MKLLEVLVTASWPLVVLMMKLYRSKTKTEENRRKLKER